MFRKADRERLERIEQAILELRLAIGDRPKNAHFSLHLKIAELVNSIDNLSLQMGSVIGTPTAAQPLGTMGFTALAEGQDKLLQSHAALEKQLDDLASHGRGMCAMLGEIGDSLEKQLATIANGGSKQAKTNRKRLTA